MTTDESISREREKSSFAPTKHSESAAKGGSGADDQPISKPSMLVMLIPILLIALAIYLAR